MFDNYSTTRKSDQRNKRKRVQLKFLLLAIAVWLVSPFIVFALPGDYPSLMPMVMMITAIGGFGLIVGFSVVSVKRGWDPNPVMAILLVSLICLKGLGTIHALEAQVHLLTNGPRYQRIVDQIASTTDDKERDKICGDDCFVLTSEPLRISFHYSHAFLSWTDIVYDSSRSIGDIRDIDDRHRLSVYFISAEHLRGDWYFGYFGD